MTIIQAIILGMVQGLTEFLPISSSGHLVLVPHLFGWEIQHEQAFIFDVLVQLGTLLAVIVYFWKDLVGILEAFLRGLIARQPFKDSQARMGWYLILATFPAMVIGWFLKEVVEAAFTSPAVTAGFLLLTAVLLLVAELVGKRDRKLGDVNWIDAVWIGAFQVLALFPGVSRSGATISGGMTRNLGRSVAARFSFLMAVPVMVAAGLLAILDLIRIPDAGLFLLPLLIGFVSAAVTGYLAIRWLLGYLANRSLYIFIIYLVIVSVIILVLL
jgi:undecaprenyl-diphosphatase